jgi:hypothetical protein
VFLQVVKKLWAIRFHVKIYVLILTNNVLGIILGDFSQTHLVTLSVKQVSRKNRLVMEKVNLFTLLSLPTVWTRIQ